MKKSGITVCIIAGIISIVTLLSYHFQSKQTHQALARIYVDNRARAGIFDPYFWHNQDQAISNYLCQPENQKLLARQSNVDEKDFYLIEIGPVSGTRLFYARFAGFESNQVICVASNASVMMVKFYSTNQPNWDVRYIEPRYSIPRNFWQDKLADVKSKFNLTFNR